jgi:uncharacterized protein DUF4112
MARRQPRIDQQEDPFVERLAWLMDNSIRIGPWSVGLDGFIGLIPGIGDMAGAAISAMIVARAMKSGISKSAILRMLFNIALDALAGSVPFVGDLFDFAFKSNTYNVQIYREALRGEREPMRDWLFILFVSLVLVIIVVVPVIGLLYLTKLLISYMQ